MYYAPTIFENRAPYPITAIFTDGQQANYTSAVLTLLITDPKVEYVLDRETGEILFHQ